MVRGKNRTLSLSLTLSCWSVLVHFKILWGFILLILSFINITTGIFMGNFISTFSFSLAAHHIGLHNLTLCSNAHTTLSPSFKLGPLLILYSARSYVQFAISSCLHDNDSAVWMHARLISFLAPWLSHQQSIFTHWSKNYFAVCHTVHCSITHSFLILGDSWI